MSDYEPSSRRPIAAVFRQTGDAATRFCVRHGIHPDAISYLSIVAALIAAICFWKSGATTLATHYRAAFLLFAALVQHARRPGRVRGGEGEPPW